jgi:P27 family predicted phage terminase small subunit
MEDSAMRGRKPKPTSMKLLAGNPGNRPLNTMEAKVGGVPACPSHLDQRARIEWNSLAPELERLGLLSSIDRAALAAYCEAYSEWAQACSILKDMGAKKWVKKFRGQEIPSPWLSVRNKAADRMRRFLVEFGLTPSSRSRIPAKPPSNPADEMELELAG